MKCNDHITDHIVRLLLLYNMSCVSSMVFLLSEDLASSFIIDPLLRSFSL